MIGQGFGDYYNSSEITEYLPIKARFTMTTRKSLGRQKDGVILPIGDISIKQTLEYSTFIKTITETIIQRKVRIVISANIEVILLYWEIGNEILQRQQKYGWGAKVIDSISVDLQNAFPSMRGFSPRNLKYMQKFAKEWPDKEIVQRIVAQIPRRSNITLLDKLKDISARIWYAQKTIEHGLSKDMLEHRISTKAYEREGKSMNNFPVSLPPLTSDLATQIFKDPYIFDFLGTSHLRTEKEFEQKLIDHIQKFLLELGQGFAFVGRQMHLELGKQDFYLDLLFYHVQLRCYVVIELKVGEFKPEYISKLNMYINVVDDILRHKDDQKTIGLLLVKSKNRTVVEYSLSGYSGPIGVSDRDQIIGENLPSIADIERELEGNEYL